MHSALSAQTIPYDTLNIDSRIHNHLDSVDVSTSLHPMTMDGGYNNTSVSNVNLNSFFQGYLGFHFLPENHWQKMKFSALPHLGFSYTFGGGGAQYIRSEYQQAFSHKHLLNIYYDRNGTNGLMRRSTFSHHNVSLLYNFIDKRFTTHLKANYNQFKVDHPGGLATDSLINDFGLEFSPVQKLDANSVNKSSDIEWDNFINFLNDSLTGFGIKTGHCFSIKNRVYTENDVNLDSIYAQINIDSVNTRDQFNLASISNGAGLYFKRKEFYIDGQVDYLYWSYQNLARRQDSVEINLASRLFLEFKKLEIINEFKMNIVGGFNTLDNLTQLNVKLKKIKWNSSVLVRNEAPQVFQRQYFANNSNYSWNDFKLRQRVSVRSQINISLAQDRVNGSVFGSHHIINNNFFFDGTKWSNDSLVRNFTELGVAGSLKFGVFNFHPRFTYFIDPTGFMPETSVGARIFLKGKLFKAKKLEAMIGVDARYLSDFKNNGYISRLDTYSYSSNSSFSSEFNLDAYVALGFGQFNFYVKMENIGYFWNDKTNTVFNNYTVGTNQLQIGITWDFFN